MPKRIRHYQILILFVIVQITLLAYILPAYENYRQASSINGQTIRLTHDNYLYGKDSPCGKLATGSTVTATRHLMLVRHPFELVTPETWMQKLDTTTMFTVSEVIYTDPLKHDELFPRARYCKTGQKILFYTLNLKEMAKQ
jgi:hypothetical protein